MKITIKFLLLSAIVLSLSVSAFARQDGGGDAKVVTNSNSYAFNTILPILDSDGLVFDGVMPFSLNNGMPEIENVKNVQVMSSCWVLVVKQDLSCYPGIKVSKGSWIDINLKNRTHNPWASYEGTQAIRVAMYNKFKYDGVVSQNYFETYTCEQWQAMHSW